MQTLICNSRICLIDDAGTWTPLEERTRKLGASSEINSISGKRLRLLMGLKRIPAKILVRFRTA